VETPDLEMFPKFEDAMKNCIQLVLRPGDMLFIPGTSPRMHGLLHLGYITERRCDTVIL
jgi:ribosomal protein L16 Arg81 hydroxylase